MAGTGCGGTLSDQEGTVTSPNYPDGYDNNMNCEWTIVGGSNDIIRLTIDDYGLEGGTGCPYDYLEVEILKLLLYTWTRSYSYMHIRRSYT